MADGGRQFVGSVGDLVRSPEIHDGGHGDTRQVVQVVFREVMQVVGTEQLAPLDVPPVTGGKASQIPEVVTACHSPSICRMIVVSLVFLLAVISAMPGRACPIVIVLSGVLSLHEWHTMVVVMIMMAILIVC